MHYNIIKYANRPFDLSREGVVDCINTIINKYNEIVKSDDIVLFVGDLAHGRNYTKQDLEVILHNMKGRKILIKGNHDNFSDDFYLTLFEDVLDYIEIDKYFISHYPCYKSKWTSKPENLHLDILNKNNCKVVIHGHIHNKDPMLWESDGIERINVCVDYEPNNFYPVELAQPKIVDYFINNY